jgi:hypothetical protein
MLRIRLLIIFGLVLTLGLVTKTPVSAATPTSSGCAIFNHNGPIDGKGATISGVFWTGETLKISSAAPFNLSITTDTAFEFSRQNAQYITIRIPATGTYTLQITPVSGNAQNVATTCTATPLSSGCLVSNQAGTLNAGTPVKLVLQYKSGELLHVGASANVHVEVIGPLARLHAVYQGISIDHRFRVDGQYTIIISSMAGSPIDFSIMCNR